MYEKAEVINLYSVKGTQRRYENSTTEWSRNSKTL